MMTFLFLFVLILSGWTIGTLLTKDDYKVSIKNELDNILESTKLLGTSIKNLIQILIKSSFLSSGAKKIEDKKDNLVSIVDNDDKKEEAKAA